MSTLLAVLNPRKVKESRGPWVRAFFISVSNSNKYTHFLDFPPVPRVDLMNLPKKTNGACIRLYDSC